MTPQEESDQLPEEQPGGAGADNDDDTQGARKDAEKNAGGDESSSEGDSDQATGNPANAG
jgi:hypothetical protein